MTAIATTPVRGPHFAGPGAWFRGNLHCHTTESDGNVSPSDAAAGFANLGYDFLAITDHDRITDPATVDAHGLCLIPSVELTASAGLLGTEFHILGIGIDPSTVLPPRTSAGRVSSAWLRNQGAAVFAAHPHWSGLTVDDLMGLTIDGIEACNGGTNLDSLKGEAFAHWDEGLLRGASWTGLGTDDTHWHTLDRGTAWVMVRATERTPGALVSAIKAGNFYGTTGPAINDVHLEFVDDGRVLKVHVHTSPVAAMYLSGPGARSWHTFHETASGITSVTEVDPARMSITSHTFEVDLTVSGPARYAGRGTGQRHIRVSCMDWSRGRAWSNPLFF